MQPIDDSTPVESDETTDEEIFCNEDDMKRSLARFCYGDLFVIGKIWIQALKVVLVGAKLCLIPVVNAAKPNEPPQKPPPMKYKDLPIYKSPHNEYKDYEADKGKCPEYNVKLLHTLLLPHVKEYRKKTQTGMNQTCCAARNIYKDMSNSIGKSKNDFKAYMRSPNNLTLRQGVVATGTLTGYLVGGGGGVPRRFFFTSIGALATGALCFPKETDEYFREACYHTAKFFIRIYNSTTGSEFSLRERIPCKDEIPPPPKYRETFCPQKK